MRLHVARGGSHNVQRPSAQHSDGSICITGDSPNVSLAANLARYKQLRPQRIGAFSCKLPEQGAPVIHIMVACHNAGMPISKSCWESCHPAHASPSAGHIWRVDQVLSMIPGEPH